MPLCKMTHTRNDRLQSVLLSEDNCTTVNRMTLILSGNQPMILLNKKGFMAFAKKTQTLNDNQPNLHLNSIATEHLAKRHWF
jgi:hypothetical protein